MEYDLDSLSRKELQALQKKVAKALDTLDDRERAAALKAAKQAAAAHGFDLSELTGSASAKAKGKSRSKSPAKYRNPTNPDQTWTGRGRKPEWFKKAEENGVDLSTLEI
ncbi:DNA-binding protein H-NS [Aliiruegeria haliotis]|uniref:DNA-binding protein H-NS n=2 Tax=Aliiruegeria haliotis TaxID=1280846 RepID=A0A2T0RKW8_9RHOB|nr:H-NS histone family protein [Aliiruegeria haliotis]PRY21834.1 DNA-binding protein H-NS [Aliiruegeria haliotis]